MSSVDNPSNARSATVAMESAPIRLLKLIALFGCGGTERQIVNLTRELDRTRFELRFACLKRWGHFLEEIEQRQKIPVAEYPVNSFYNPDTFRQQLRFAADIRQHRTQIVHSYNFYANTFAVPAAKLAGAPVIIASIRDAGVYLTPGQKRMQRLVCRLADCVLVNAEAIQRWLVDQGYRPEKIRVIRNGIDLSRFTGKRDGTALRREWGLPPQAPLVVMLARLNPQKGFEYFLEAAAIVARRCPTARFIIVGEGHLVHPGGVVKLDDVYEQELKRLADRLGLGERLVFAGFRSDVPALLAEAAVSVLPSLSEGLSNTLLESMAAGVPVIATRVGGNPEIVAHGQTGLLVPVRDAGALAEAIGTLLCNPDLARHLGQAGQQWVTEHCSLARMVRDTEALYVELLEKKLCGNRRGSVDSANRKSDRDGKQAA